MLFYVLDFIHDDFKENGFFVATKQLPTQIKTKYKGIVKRPILKISQHLSSMKRINRQIKSF